MPASISMQSDIFISTIYESLKNMNSKEADQAAKILWPDKVLIVMRTCNLIL